MFMLLAGQVGEAWELPLCSASEVSMDRASPHLPASCRLTHTVMSPTRSGCVELTSWQEMTDRLNDICRDSMSDTCSRPVVQKNVFALVVHSCRLAFKSKKI